MLRRKTILLTGIGGNTAQGVARSLLHHSDEFRLIGTDSDKFNIRLGSRYVSKSYLIPRARQVEDYLAELNRIIEAEGVDLLIPSPDVEVYTVSRYRSEIEAKTMLPSHGVVETAQDKWAAYLRLRGRAPQPGTLLVENDGDVEEAFNLYGSPLWLRMRKGAGGSKSFLAHTPGHAVFWIDYWDGYGEFLASEYLRGRNLSWTGLYYEGRLVTSAGYHRVRYLMEHVSPTGVTGNINVGVTIHSHALNLAAERAVAALDSKPHGVYTVDLKEDAEKAGTPRVTEINPGRFHMSFYVYTAAGLNMPYYYVKAALGEPFEEPAKRNALAPGVVTVRSVDNEPAILIKSRLGSGNPAQAASSKLRRGWPTTPGYWEGLGSRLAGSSR